MVNAQPYTGRLITAFRLAASLHQHQMRKGARKTPYINHCMAVAALVGEYGGTEDQVIAALLHDVVEDCGVDILAIVDRFGPQVGSYVERLSDYIGPKTEEKPKWRPRKEAYLARLVDETPDLKLISVCDKLHNVTTTLRDLRAEGRDAWASTRPKQDLVWYYERCALALSHNWSHPLLTEFETAVGKLAAWAQQP